MAVESASLDHTTRTRTPGYFGSTQTEAPPATAIPNLCPKVEKPLVSEEKWALARLSAKDRLGFLAITSHFYRTVGRN
jgi:hypothetical protein